MVISGFSSQWYKGFLEGLGDKDRRGSKGFSGQNYVFSEGLGDKETRSSQGLSRQLVSEEVSHV